MAKRKKDRRDTSVIARPRLLDPHDGVTRRMVIDLRPLQDLRTFQFGEQVVKSHFRAAVTPVVRSTKNNNKPFRFRDPFKSVPAAVTLKAPRAVAVCVRRQRRKEVLFAKNKTGKGAARRRAQRNWTSSINCKG